MGPAISVVIPTYNGAAFIVETLESVFAQTCHDYEVIVVDDGSGDETPSILRRYGDRLTVVTQSNRGIGAARNRGIDAARGKYVALLDHDDLWKPDKLRRQLAYMHEHPDVIGCSVPFTYSDDESRPGFDLGIAGVDGRIRDALQAYASGQLFLLSSIMMLDRERIAGLRYEEERGAIEDIAMQIRLLMRGPYAIAGSDPMAVYRVHATNESTSALHLYRGLRRLRELERSGAFSDGLPGEKAAAGVIISTLGRKVVVAQVGVGERSRAMRAYVAEFMHQVRHRRWKFLAIVPALLLVPTAFLRRWGRFQARS